MNKKISVVLLILFAVPMAIVGANAAKMLCYSIQPNEYVNDHAAEIARIYDGFFYVLGAWDSSVIEKLGIDGRKPQNTDWMKAARKNISALKKAGATENLMGIYFAAGGEWPSAETLLSDKYTEKMRRYFSRVAEAANELGFKGLSIDVEYPYPRYQVDNNIYTYENYTADDLIKGAEKQGRAVMEAVLEKFPQAVIMVLPGSLRARPISQAFQLGMLKTMAEKDASGGFHLGTEFTYSMSDPLTYFATTVFEDCGMHLLVDKNVLDYWKKRCDMAPGVWPLHMVETGSKHYKMRPWKDEVKDIAEEMAILRTITDKYIWSYTGHPVWYVWSKEIEKKYGLKKQTFKQNDVDIKDWHDILMQKNVLPKNDKWRPLVKTLSDYKVGRIDENALCSRFGTPAKWWLLGMLGNIHTKPQFAAQGACFDKIDPSKIYFGRDQTVHWTEFDNMDPRGMIPMRKPFGWYKTDSCSAQLVSFIHSDKDYNAELHIGWDDGIIVYLDDEMVLDKRNYPKRGKGLDYLDRYRFEAAVPVKIRKGKSRLSVVSINSHGNWIYSLRLTDKKGLPIEGVYFELK